MQHHSVPSSWDFNAVPEQWSTRFIHLETAESGEEASALSAQFPSSIDNLALTYPKYRGKTPVQVAVRDPSYLVWCFEKFGTQVCSQELRDWCKQVADRIGPPQAQGHLKYGARR